jgi:hypothetical protein
MSKNENKINLEAENALNHVIFCYDNFVTNFALTLYPRRILQPKIKIKPIKAFGL